MVIVVNTRNLPDGFPEYYPWFMYETFKRITRNNPVHKFIFIVDSKSEQNNLTGDNIEIIKTDIAAKHPLLWKFWYDIKLPRLLKKYKATVFVSGDGCCSLTTKVPQCLIIHDLAFLHPSLFINKAWVNFYKKNTPKFLAKATIVATETEFVKQSIITNYKIPTDKVDVVFSGIDSNFQPANEDKKIITKQTYTEGREFFLYSGEIHPRNNLLKLLKAFSVFKKRQQTNMKLVLMGKLATGYQSFKEDLKSYKYRHDVVMMEETEMAEQIKIMGAAYGFVYPSLYDGIATTVLASIRCRVPVIIPQNSVMQGIVKDAALLIEANNHTDIADKMMLLYKDENLRKKLIENGQSIDDSYDWEKTAELLWQSILKTAG